MSTEAAIEASCGRKNKARVMPGIRIDYAWKYLLSEFFDEFMEFAVPVAHREIDWQRGFEFLDKELSKIADQSATGPLCVDKLVKVYLKDGSINWVLIHCEVQSQVQTNFAERMAIYNASLYAQHLVPVLSIVVLLDEQGSWVPNQHVRSIWGCENRFIFPLLKLLDFKGQELSLKQSSNVLAHVLLYHLKLKEEKKKQGSLRQIKLHLAEYLFAEGFTQAKIIRLLRFLDLLIALPPAEALKFRKDLHQVAKVNNMQEILSTTEQVILQEGIEKGIEEGIEKGIAQAHYEQIDIAKALLSEKFGPLSPKAIHIIQTADQRGLFILMQRSAVAKTLDDVFDA